MMMVKTEDLIGYFYINSKAISISLCSMMGKFKK